MQINEKLSFETDVAVLFTFIMPNALHILGLTSWSTCCYMSINHFLGERKEELKKPHVQSFSRNKKLFSDSQEWPVTFHFYHYYALSFQWQWPALSAAELVTAKCTTKRAPSCLSAPQHLSRESVSPWLLTYHCPPFLSQFALLLTIFWGWGLLQYQVYPKTNSFREGAVLL